jgi:hypothetical protein
MLAEALKDLSSSLKDENEARAFSVKPRLKLVPKL